MGKIVVIGAGASGCIAALKLSEKHEVILLEKENKILKKILLTGNGKCNFYHVPLTVGSYYTDDLDKLKSLLKKEKEVFSYLTSLGIAYVNNNGYLYPKNKEAASFREVLVKNIEKSNIVLKKEVEILSIVKKDKFEVTLKDEVIKNIDNIVIATSSLASKYASSFGLDYASFIGHDIKVSPALTPIILNSNILKLWDGVRCEGKIKLYIDGVCKKEEEGELQLTSYGISGIPTFNISSFVSSSLTEEKKVEVSIDFIKDYDIKMRVDTIKDKRLESVFETLIPYKLSEAIYKYGDLKKDDIYTNRVYDILKNMKFEVTGVGDFMKAQVATGGVLLHEVDDTLQSKKQSGVYFTGEVLNVDGICGGYNLAFAFISGYEVASCIK